MRGERVYRVGGEELIPAAVPVVTWSKGEHRRAVLAPSYRDVKTVFRRVLDRFRGGKAQYEDLQSEITRLEEPGAPLTVGLGGHTITFVRPFRLASDGTSEDPAAEAPVLIARERPMLVRELECPVLARDIERARALARRIRDTGMDISKWRRYETEWTPNATKTFVFSAGPSLRTELESDLIRTFGKQGQRNQGFFLGGGPG